VTKPDYFIISGMFRTGTTLLTRLLDAHPRASAQYQPITPFFKLWLDRYRTRTVGRAADADRPMGIDDWTREQYDRFCREIVRVNFESRDIDRLKAAIIEDVTNDSGEKPRHFLSRLGTLAPGTGPEILEQLYGIVAADVIRPQTAWFGVKELWIEEFFAPLQRTLGMRAMHLIRDPRAIFASRNYGKILEQRNFARYPLLFIVHSWLRSRKYARWNRSSEDDYMTVRYEDLVGDAPHGLQEICRWFAIDHSDAMWDPSRLKDGKGERWLNNSSFFAGTGGIYQEACAHWRDVMKEDEVGAIEFLCGRELEEAGYQRTLPGFGEKEFLAFREDPEGLTSWLRKAPFIMSAAQKRRELENPGMRSEKAR
jgi:hypothetical protein